VICGKCKAQLIIQINGKDEQKGFAQNAQKKCSICDQDFHESLSSAIVHFIRWYELAQQSEHDI